MPQNDEKLKRYAKDLRSTEPRHASEKLAGFDMGARCLDKCRATLLGINGDYTYGCPMDRMFLRDVGLSPDEFKDFVATGASDEEVEKWLVEHCSTAHE